MFKKLEKVVKACQSVDMDVISCICDLHNMTLVFSSASHGVSFEVRGREYEKFIRVFDFETQLYVGQATNPTDMLFMMAEHSAAFVRQAEEKAAQH